MQWYKIFVKIRLPSGAKYYFLLFEIISSNCEPLPLFIDFNITFLSFQENGSLDQQNQFQTVTTVATSEVALTSNGLEPASSESIDTSSSNPYGNTSEVMSPVVNGNVRKNTFQGSNPGPGISQRPPQPSPDLIRGSPLTRHSYVNQAVNFSPAHYSTLQHQRQIVR